MKIAVISTDGCLKDIKLPIEESRLNLVAETNNFLEREEEIKILQWVKSVHTRELECPISDGRMEELLTHMRTLPEEDKILCNYVLDVWKVVQRIIER